MAIKIYTGRPGSGKTYLLARFALKFLKKRVNVWSNFVIKPPTGYEKYLHHWKSIRDLIHVENGIILMDEAQIYLNARRWKDLPEEWEYKLQQHRKEGLHIFGSVQDLKRADTVLRELVGEYYECHKIFGIILVHEYNIKDAGLKKRKSLWTSVYLLRKKFYQSYDTLEKIVKI